MCGQLWAVVFHGESGTHAAATLDGAILDVLEAHPSQGFKISELCKRMDQAKQGQNVAKASAGAVVLAAQRLVRKGKAVLAVEKRATFQFVTTAPPPPTGNAGSPRQPGGRACGGT